jgi:hypothetical protein
MMTDEKIKKALECCSKDDKEICAKECPLFRTAGCVEELHKLILGRIRLQEPDVKDYQRNIIEMDKFARDLCNKRLLNENKIVTFEDLQSYISKQKAEAVREFAEKLNAEFENLAKMFYYGTTYTLVGKGVVNRVVNEMFGNFEQVKGE